MSAVRFNVPGCGLKEFPAVVIDSPATMFWPYMCATEADSRMSARERGARSPRLLSAPREADDELDISDAQPAVLDGL